MGLERKIGIKGMEGRVNCGDRNSWNRSSLGRARKARPACLNMVHTSEQVSKKLGDILGDVPTQDVVDQCEVAYPFRGWFKGLNLLDRRRYMQHIPHLS